MTILHTDLDLPTPVAARIATAADEPALRHLWLLFRHDMSGVTGTLPGPDGTYRSERLDAALDAAKPSWQPWLLSAGPQPVGLAITRALDEPTRVLSSFFLVAPVRRGGLGTAFARAVLEAAPGEWSVAYQESNAAAAAFWPRLAQAFDKDSRRGVQGPDTWLTFTVTAPRS
ncbi:GNAT family N-acetyltransferase [Myceligenerans crystallogenes]|uniref:N-acetyltransferase domain-containing protein n=1 Tax=Myceligenerans crystallogenes TaxID=316335 RepID=A0ABN2NM47_9MICO